MKALKKLFGIGKSIETKETQEQVILNYLKSGKKISQLEATQKFNFIRLSAIVYSLNKKGHNIKCEMVYKPNGIKYGVYSLIDQINLSRSKMGKEYYILIDDESIVKNDNKGKYKSYYLNLDYWFEYRATDVICEHCGKSFDFLLLRDDFDDGKENICPYCHQDDCCDIGFETIEHALKRIENNKNKS